MQAGHGVPHDRQQAVEHEGEEGRERADAGEAEPGEQGHHDREERQGRHRLDDAREGEDGRLERARAADEDARRHGHQDAGREGGERETDVGGEVLGQESELGAHDRPSRRSATRRAWRRGVSRSRATSSSAGERRELARGPDLHEPAASHDADAVGEDQSLGHVVGDEDRGEDQAPTQVVERALQPVPGQGVEGPEGLVEEHHAGRGGQGPGHADPLLLAAGESGGEAPGEGGVELDEGEQLRDASDPAVARPSQEAQRHRDVLGHGHVGEQADALEDVADRPPERVELDRGGVAPLDDHPPGVRLHEAVDHLERRRLPRAGVADEGQHLPRVHLERDVGDGERLPVAPREAGDLDHPGHSATRSLRSAPRARADLRPPDARHALRKLGRRGPRRWPTSPRAGRSALVESSPSAGRRRIGRSS